MILKLLNKGSNVFYFLTHKAYLILVHLPISFFWHWPKIEEKGKDNGGILECLGSPFHLFPKLYFSCFHRGLKLVAWHYKEKPVVAELSFSIAIPKATPIKCMFSSDEALRDHLSPPMASRCVFCLSKVLCDMGKLLPPSYSLFIWKIWAYSHLAGFLLYVKALAPVYKIVSNFIIYLQGF